MQTFRDSPQTHRVGPMAVLVRGWLHGNVVRIGVDLVDTGFHTGVEALRDWLIGPVERVFLTHVHSDHAGGVHALEDEAEVFAHPDARAIVDPWNPEKLWLAHQELPRFRIDHGLGSHAEIGGVSFEVIHVPGHATGGVAFLSEDGVMIVGDALWEKGFGLLNPEVDGPQVFDEAALALDRIEAATPRVVIPGHGPPFEDVEGALARARSLLERIRDPAELRRRRLTSGMGFMALMKPELDRAGLIAFLRRGGGDPGEPWVAPLLDRLRPERPPNQ